MAAICTKEFALHVGPAVSLVAYYKFDDPGPPFQEEVDNTLNELIQSSLNPPTSGAVGILNDCIRFSGVPVGSTSIINGTDFNPEIKIDHGFTWTTWVNVATFGDASNCVIFRVIFANAGGVTQVDLRADMNGFGAGPAFITCVLNGASVFSPTATYGSGVWNLIRVQFNHTTRKIGIQRANTVFGIGGMEESIPIGNDLSAIVKGYLQLQCTRGLFSGASPDYRQDESGFWARLLTDAEFATLFGGGTPPAYPAIP